MNDLHSSLIAWHRLTTVAVSTGWRMRHHLPVLFLFTPQDCHLTAVVLSTGSRMCLPFHFFFFLTSIVRFVRPKSLIHMLLSPFSFLLSSDPSHSFVYPFHPSLSYYRPAQVTPSYTLLTFLFLIIVQPSHSFVYPFHLFLHFPMPISSSKPRARQLTLSLCPDPRRTCPIHLRPFAHRGLHAASAYHYFCPRLRSFAHHDLHTAPASYYLYPKLRPFVHHGLHAASA
ncbi:uncharacterized protein F5147DRAFT_117557 [Suillus discolor]|uniref:Uncharacterized protein n=1 Tax=Suillus discolor TaxID=1912936 RepID=A0A9P7FJM8_9AGAM|nr:uncharacterized protein F5147DRAFT_117557 [Suillus discolor]KAG2119590.1 hypothetical protein F5147DRAFT_117557 [Suillus discolor]